MKKATILLMFTFAIMSCNSDINRPPDLSNTENKLKNKDKFNFSQKTNSEYTDEFGNYIADGYGYRPDPMSCNNNSSGDNEEYLLELSKNE